MHQNMFLLSENQNIIRDSSMFFFTNGSEVRDRYPLSGVRQMRDDVPHLPDPT